MSGGQGSMGSDTTRWVIAGVCGFSLVVLNLIIAFQGSVDSRQDQNLRAQQEVSEALTNRLERITESQSKMLIILTELSAKVDFINDRGSKAIQGLINERSHLYDDESPPTDTLSRILDSRPHTDQKKKKPPKP